MNKIILAILIASAAQPGQKEVKNVSTMETIDQIYTVFITNKLDESVKFYQQYFGFTKLFESTFFVLLQTSGDKKFCIAFMDEQHPTAPPTPARYNGSGAFLTLEVPDAKAMFEEMTARGLAVNYKLKDEAWGQKRFGILDPNGLWVDVVQQIEPQEGYWSKYIKD